MLQHIGAALGQPNARQDRQPVWRHSRLTGRCEGVFWRRTSRQEVRRIVLAARRYELTGRPTGRRNGPLGHIALEVLEYLSHLVCYRTGRLEPSVAYLMERLRRSKSAIHEALNALRAHGFLDWLRRFEPTGREGRGPQVRQVSNAYRMSLPPRAARLIGAPPPLPDLDRPEPIREPSILDLALQAMSDARAGTHTLDPSPYGAWTSGFGLSERPPKRPPERESATRSES
jgi:hypothetical protein